MNFVYDRIGRSVANDLLLVQCGVEDCKPGHSFGPYIRDHHLIHCITGGQGKFVINKREYSLGTGELFYIPPKIATFYQADFSNPWSYSWIGLRGIAPPTYFNAVGLSEKSPVMKFSPELLSALNDVLKHSRGLGIESARTIGLLYFFIDELVKCGNPTEKYKSNGQIYVETIVRYIHDNIHKKLTVSGLSEIAGIDRSYLCAIFNELLGISPQQYIIDTKIGKAKKFLTETSYEIKYIAASLGYEDQFVFSHIFKAKTGFSPREWRNRFRIL